MTTPIELDNLSSIEDMAGEDAAETATLREMFGRAEEYLKSFRWCPPIANRYFGYGIGGVFALFLFRFQHAISKGDEYLWVVEGDLPSAYFVVDEARDVEGAIVTYCNMMEEWAQAVLSRSSLDAVFPVAAPPTKENAMKLLSRVEFLRNRILPTV